MAQALNTDPSPVELRCFPSDDPDFARFARAALARLAAPVPAELQRAIRERYPLAVVSVQTELGAARPDQVVWYAFRRAGNAPPAEAWWEREEAWVVLGQDRSFVEASEAFAALVEVPLPVLIGRRVEDLANPADVSVQEDIAALWQDLLARGVADGTLRFNRLDGSRREIEYHAEQEAGGSGRFRAVVRER